MNNNNNILTLNQRPLKYIVTKNKEAIKLLSETGSLIVYEPNDIININVANTDDIYRELWVASYFLAGGYGAKTRDDQEMLSYIAANYNNHYTYINYRIDQAYSYSYGLYNILNNNKVSKGYSYSYTGDDISFNTFNFGGETITLNDLYNKFKDIRILYKFELSKVDYLYTFVDTNNSIHTYDNLAHVPIGSRLKEINIKLKGNTRDSGGINKIYLSLNNQINNSKYILKLEDLSKEGEIPNKSNTQFELTITKTFQTNNDEYLYEIHDGINYIINNIQICTNGGSNNNLLINPLDADIIDNILELYPTYLYGSITCLYYTGPYNGYRAINNYSTKLIVDNQMDLSIFDYNNIQCISILINNDVRLVKAEYYDQITCQVYDIIDFILTKYNSVISDQTYTVEYLIKVDNNIDYNPNINPPFLTKDSNNIIHFNEGYIIFTFIKSSETDEIIKLKNTNKYWITYTGNQDNFPL